MGANQLAFSFPEPKRRGGARQGAGGVFARNAAPRAGGSSQGAPGACHAARGAAFASSQQVARTLLSGVRDSNRDWFRVVHYSVQTIMCI